MGNKPVNSRFASFGLIGIGSIVCLGWIGLAELPPIPAIAQACLRLGLLLLFFALIAFLIHRICKATQSSNRQHLIQRTSFVVLCILFVEVSSVVLLDYLFKRKPDLRRLYNVALQIQPDYVGPAVSLNYADHHYLNYALNPSTPYMGTQQYNEQYLIRRTEPIRARNDVAWRAIVLGGSTTFGEQIAREEDTWVHQLEQHVRAKWGAECDVINGGVGGYTLVENVIHYMTSLTELDADVVFLYEGINDVHPRLYDNVRRDYSGYRVPWRSEGKSIPNSNEHLHFSATYRFGFTLTQLLPIQRGNIHDTVSESYPPISVWRERLAANPPTIYESHLQNFVRFLKAQGKQVVIIPQYFDRRTTKDAIFSIGVEQNNAVNRSVAYNEGVAFVETVLEANSFHSDDTFDNCHFTEQGSVRMAELINSFLMERPQLARSMQDSVRVGAKPN